MASVALPQPPKDVANNPFWRLPLEVVANIKAMKSDRHPPTPSAIAIQEAGLRFERQRDIDAAIQEAGLRFEEGQYEALDEAEAEVGTLWVRTRPDGPYFVGAHDDDNSGVRLNEIFFPINADEFERSMRSEWDSVLGRVLTDADLELRWMRRDPRMSGTRELHDAWLRVQREEAEASGMF